MRKQVWDKCKHLRTTQEGFLTALGWRFSPDLQDAKLILRFLASPPFMSLPEHSCVNLSLGCLFASYKLPPLGSLGTSALPGGWGITCPFPHFYASSLPLRQECKVSFLGQAENVVISRPSRFSLCISFVPEELPPSGNEKMNYLDN